MDDAMVVLKNLGVISKSKNPGSVLDRNLGHSIPISTDEVIYLHRQERQQIHGMSWLHAVTTRLRNFDDYFEALTA